MGALESLIQGDRWERRAGERVRGVRVAKPICGRDVDRFLSDGDAEVREPRERNPCNRGISRR